MNWETFWSTAIGGLVGGVGAAGFAFVLAVWEARRRRRQHALARHIEALLHLLGRNLVAHERLAQPHGSFVGEGWRCLDPEDFRPSLVAIESLRSAHRFAPLRASVEAYAMQAHRGQDDAQTHEALAIECRALQAALRRLADL